MKSDPLSNGFVLSDSAMYAFSCQEVYPDIISFAAAIPDHLKPIFLIPVQVQIASKEPSDKILSIASKIASPTGESDSSDLFGYKTFVNYDNEPAITPGNEGSIYDHTQTPEDIPVSQPGDQFCGDHPRYDARVVEPFDTSYYNDGDSTDLFYEGYPYRTDQQVRHSFVKPLKVRISIKPELLQNHAPNKTKQRSKTCSVKFISYMKPDRMYTFSVGCGNNPHLVHAVLSEIDEISMSCDCPFWRWNGPEYHAKVQNYLLDKPRGTASPPNVRDPDRIHWLCKHAYAVLRRLEEHVQRITDENWELDDQELLNAIDSEWDRLEGVVEVPLQEIEEEDPETITDVSKLEIEEEPETEEDELIQKIV
jgi:hypothetical protein